MKKITIVTFWILAVGILLVTVKGVSSEGVVPWFRISDIPALQDIPDAAYNSSSNQFLVVWEDFRGAGIGTDVYAQLVNSDGSMSGGNFSITVAADWQRGPKPAYIASTGKYLVVWEDHNNNDIYGRLVNANGTLSGTQFPIATAAEYQWNPDLVYNPTSNQSLVVFDDDRLISGDNDIYGQFVNADGNLSGGNFTISFPSTDQILPAVAYNSTNNQYLVIWEDDRNPASDADIYGRVVNANGSMDGADFPISTASADQSYPDIAYASSANRFLAVWEQSADIYGRLVNANKTFAGSEFRIASSSGTLSNPAVSYDPASDQFLVVWSDSFAWDNIYAQQVSVDGSMPEPVIDLASGRGNFINPAITIDTTNHQFLVAWQHQTCLNELNCDDYEKDIYGALYQTSAHYNTYLPVLLRNFQPPVLPVPSNTPVEPTATPVTPTPPPPPTSTPDPWVNIMNEDFEGVFPAGLWIVLDDYAGYGEYYWGKRNCQSFTGSYSAWVVGGGADGSLLSCGSSYPGFVKSWMIYGPFNLSDALEAEFSYKAWINTGNAGSLYQNFCRLASTDGTNFYGDCYRGNSGGWIDQGLDFSNVTDYGSMLGESQVWIGMYFENLATAGATEGGYVDDLILRKCTSSPCSGLNTDFLGSAFPELYQFPAVNYSINPGD